MQQDDQDRQQQHDGVLQYQPLQFGVQDVLTSEKARNLLGMVDRSIPAVPFKPKGGEIYLLKVEQASRVHDWRATGYRHINFRLIITILNVKN